MNTRANKRKAHYKEVTFRGAVKRVKENIETDLSEQELTLPEDIRIELEEQTDQTEQDLTLTEDLLTGLEEENTEQNTLTMAESVEAVREMGRVLIESMNQQICTNW